MNPIHNVRQNDNEDNDNEDSDEVETNDAFFQYLLRSMVFEQQRFSASNEELIQLLKEKKMLKDDRIEKAFRTIPRGFFVPEELKAEAYSDNPLRIPSMGFNVSAPHMYAICLENLDIQPGMSFLDIGSGCGHFTTIGAFLVGKEGKSLGLEVRKDIREFAEANVKRFCEENSMEFPNLSFVIRNCFLPDPDDALYDRIHVGACCPESRLEDLCKLLAPRGILVTPFGDKLVKMTKGLDGKVTTEPVTSVRYGELVVPSEAEIKEAKLLIERKRALTVVVPPNTITQELGRMVNCEELSDIVFIIDEKKLYAHKFILCVRSPHFRVMLTGGMKESQQSEIAITNFNFETFYTVIKFLYTGELASGVLTGENCVELLEASNYFKVERMKALCEHFLHTEIDVENVSHLFHVAENFDAKQLRSVCFEFIVSHFTDVSKTKAFNEMPRDLLVIVTQEVVQRLTKVIPN